MKSNKIIQKKFRIDSNTDKIFKKILSVKKESMQSVMESLIKDYIYKNFETIMTEDK